MLLTFYSSSFVFAQRALKGQRLWTKEGMTWGNLRSVNKYFSCDVRLVKLSQAWFPMKLCHCWGVVDPWAMGSHSTFVSGWQRKLKVWACHPTRCVKCETYTKNVVVFWLDFWFLNTSSWYGRRVEAMCCGNTTSTKVESNFQFMVSSFI